MPTPPPTTFSAYSLAPGPEYWQPGSTPEQADLPDSIGNNPLVTPKVWPDPGPGNPASYPRDPALVRYCASQIVTENVPPRDASNPLSGVPLMPHTLSNQEFTASTMTKTAAKSLATAAGRLLQVPAGRDWDLTTGASDSYGQVLEDVAGVAPSDSDLVRKTKIVNAMYTLAVRSRCKPTDVEPIFLVTGPSGDEACMSHHF